VLATPAAAQASVPFQTVVPCSSSALVTAISQANSARFATLVLARDCTYVLTTPAAQNDGLPPVTGNLIILGSGGTTISRSSSAGHFRIFDVPFGGRLVLANVTVAGGFPADDLGGGIVDDGAVVLRNVRLAGNTASSGGGLAVLNGAHATVLFSELEGNNAIDSDGGAIENAGDLVVDHSRLTRNAARRGAGVSTARGTTTRISGTVIARNGAGDGGGIFNEGATVLTGDRVVFNFAAAGGGIEIFAGTVTLRFTQVAFNTPDNCFPPGRVRGCRN
jgi:hypothetical protein